MKVYIITDKYGITCVFDTIKKAEEWLLKRGIIKKSNETCYTFADKDNGNVVYYIEEWVLK